MIKFPLRCNEFVAAQIDLDCQQAIEHVPGAALLHRPWKPRKTSRFGAMEDERNEYGDGCSR